jgi:hypothetical protein
MSFIAGKRARMMAGAAIAGLIGMGTLGATIATAATRSATGGAAAHVKISNGPNAVGTYEWYLNGDQGHITLASNNTWTADNYGDGGTWLVTGKTIAISFTTGGDVDTLEMGTVGKHGLSSASKPGHWVNPANPNSGTWYAVKVG